MTMGRPKKIVNFEQLDKLLAIHCTERECAYFFEMSIETLNEKVKEEFGRTFLEYKGQKETIGKVQLRRKQFELAMEGNVTMLVWLGKNMLDQRDKTHAEVNYNHQIVDKLAGLADEDLRELAKRVGNGETVEIEVELAKS